MLSRQWIFIVVAFGWGFSAVGHAQEPTGNRTPSGSDSSSVLPPSAVNWDDVLAPIPLTQTSPRSPSEFGDLTASLPTTLSGAASQDSGRLDVAWNRAPNPGLPAMPSQASSTPGPENAAAFAGTVQGRLLQKTKPVANCHVVILPMNNDGIDQSRTPLTTTTDSEGVYHFENVPVGNYKLTWLPAGSNQWIRRIEMKPDVIVHAGQDVQLKDIRASLQTIN